MKRARKEQRFVERVTAPLLWLLVEIKIERVTGKRVTRSREPRSRRRMKKKEE
jgi:hypothetical protein